jgi:hypothetical protein
MTKPLYLLALGVPLVLGASLPPANPLPQARSTDVMQVNVIDRFLQDSGIRQRRSSSERSRARPQGGRSAIPRPPALASVPLPIPKPSQEAQVAAGASEEPARDAENAPSAPQTRPPEASAGSQPAGTPSGNQPVTDPAKPEADRPETTDTQPAKPDEPAPFAAETTADRSAPAPVVEQPATAAEPARPSDVPTPTAKPETTDTGKSEAGADRTSEDQPRDTADKPDGEKPEDGDKTENEEKAEAEPPPPPLVKEDPQELQACLADLKAIGAKFQTTDPINEGNGCGIENPIDVEQALPGIDLGGATMRCKTALTMAHWLKDTVQPALNIAMPGRRIVGLVPGSTYQCRLRNSASTGKISEHARGNAYDVAAFRLDNGETIEMKPRAEDSTLEGAFQRTATAGACLHFTTVLSPGSDAAHEDHLHLDILERSNGYRYCR